VDELDRFLKQHARDEQSGRRGIFCPSELEIDQYVSNLLGQEDSQFIQQHLHACLHCREEVEALQAEAPPLFGAVPEQARAHLEKLVHGHSSPSPIRGIATVIVERARDIIRIIETTGEILAQGLADPAAAALRGEEPTQDATFLQHILGPYVITAAFRPFPGGKVHVDLLLRRAEDEEPVSGEAVHLKDADKEQRKTTDLLGKVSFMNLAPGAYQVVIGEDDSGPSMTLEIRSAPS